MKKHFYVLVRRDLTHEQQMCQAVHAAHEAGRKIPEGDPAHRVVVCTVKNEIELMVAMCKILSSGIDATEYRDLDLGFSTTAFATGPVDPDQRSLFSVYPLWTHRTKE